jgi:Mrp family chromosome partitioning ATPase
MQTIGELFEWVIIDSPPFLPLADASIWERWADGVIVVARQGTSRKRMLQKGLEAIDPQKLLCALLNVSSEGGVQDYYSYYRNEMN